MNQLMIHVERIVRPVRTTQKRKLRMRLELLAHLEAAVDEERLRFPGDERAAMVQAKGRLGEPEALTRRLQKSVPVLERILFARALVGRRLECWELRIAQAIYGIRGVMTLGHVAVLMLLAGLLTGNPFYLSSTIRNAITKGVPLAHVTAFFLILLIGLQIILLASCRFVFAIADPEPKWDWIGNIRRGISIIFLQIGLIYCMTAAAVNGLPAADQIAACGATTVLMLMLSTLVARHIGKSRRAYDEWLDLDIAE